MSQSVPKRAFELDPVLFEAMRIVLEGGASQRTAHEETGVARRHLGNALKDRVALTAYRAKQAERIAAEQRAMELKAVEMRAEGMSVPDIARHFKRARLTIYSWLHAHMDVLERKLAAMDIEAGENRMRAMRAMVELCEDPEVDPKDRAKCAEVVAKLSERPLGPNLSRDSQLHVNVQANTNTTMVAQSTIHAGEATAIAARGIFAQLRDEGGLGKVLDVDLASVPEGAA